ncbi:MAG: FAD-dependent oxidoreductase [Eubacteriales bacterium]|nr:FAD-dependent oxidoreductase [Eubacteriales bacterium]
MSKILIIGGVAAGAGCAARLRRLDETARIVMLERGEYISYANCGLPYHVGDVIQSRDALLVTRTEVMRERFGVDVRTRTEAVSIDRANKTVRVKNLETGECYDESYDKLVIATGSSPLRPPIPGIDSPRILTLWTVPDADHIRSMIREKGAKSAVVVGGGFIGLEMAENLRHAGLSVAIVEATDQVMAPIDPEMAMILHENIRANGVDLHLSDGVASFEDSGSGVDVNLGSGKKLTADFVILSIGVRPNSLLAREAGLELNARGGIVVDEYLRTADPDIYAAGDVIEVEDFLTKDRTMVPLAGPANKQGRIVADNIANDLFAGGHPAGGHLEGSHPAGGHLAGGRLIGEDTAWPRSTYKGTQGSSVAQVFDLVAASTGLNEKKLLRRGLVRGKDYTGILITQNSHAGYYPGALPMFIKLLFSMDGSRIYGAQIVGQEGVDKRIDTIGTAIRFGAGVTALKDLELAYAPPFSSAKDPVNMTGFTAENVLRGLVRFSGLQVPENAVILDVREEAELLGYTIPGARNIPLGQLRARLGELDPSAEYVVICAVGVRSYNGARILMQNGFENVEVYPAGTRLYRILHPDAETEAAAEMPEISGEKDGDRRKEMNKEVKKVTLHCDGLQCPGPIMEVFRSIKEMEDGQLLEVSASDPGFAKDIESWCRRTGNTLVSNGRKGRSYVAVIRKGIAAAAPAVQPDKQIPSPAGSPPQGKTIIVFDGDLDKVLASFVIANGALAMGRPVTMFFTFWGLTALRRTDKQKLRKTPVEKMFGAMLPRGTTELGLSRMNMGGMGTKMMRAIMKDKNIDSLEEMMKKAMENGVRIVACSMSMDVMGIRKEELIDGVEIGGVGTYLGDAEESNVNLFI